MTGHRRSRRGWIGAVLSFALGGPMVALAVAWSIAAWMPAGVPITSIESDEGPHWPTSWAKQPKQVASRVYLNFGLSEYTTTLMLFVWNDGVLRVAPGAPDPPLGSDSALLPPQMFLLWVTGGSVGWPIKCVFWQDSNGVAPMLGSDSNYTVTDEFLIEERVIVPPLSDRVSPGFYQRLASVIRNKRPIPVAVLWPGLLVNSAFWGTLLVCVVFGPRVVRRWRRQRRGACLECGYALTYASGDKNSLLRVCPECGEMNRAANTGETSPALASAIV